MYVQEETPETEVRMGTTGLFVYSCTFSEERF